MNRALCQHQGRPRRAARPGRHLHAGGAGPDRAGRLAHERVFDAGGRPSTAAPTFPRAALRHAQLPSRCCIAVWPTPIATSATDILKARPSGSLRPCLQPHGSPQRPAADDAERRHVWRGDGSRCCQYLRRRATAVLAVQPKFPPADDSGLRHAASFVLHRRAWMPSTWPKPPWRRWPTAVSTTNWAAVFTATQRRSHLAGAPLREDALRQRPTGCAPTCTPGRSREPLYRRIVEETLRLCAARDDQPPEGGFYSTQDADSEGEEGKFFVWTPSEDRGAAGDPLTAAIFGQVLRRHLSGQLRRQDTILSIVRPVEQVAQRFGAAAPAELENRRWRHGRREAVCPAGDAHQTGPRREDSDRVERADDPRPG
jgi:hypothetical protein